MRGEYAIGKALCVTSLELPPRARRIQNRRIFCDPQNGTTSACAENTQFSRLHLQLLGNYLRVRGEYTSNLAKAHRETELPPRARRIHPRRRSKQHHPGTTSACAENTWLGTCATGAWWNYLRVRGEYWVAAAPLDWMMELPPRARRIQVYPACCARSIGTTSACAENTTSKAKPIITLRNYLRVRGEYRR